MSPRAPRVVLILVLGLVLVSETALSPFYPRLFRELFGVEDYASTGRYIWIARIAGLAALPLWGLAARRWSLSRLVATGLSASVVLDAALGLMPTFASFTVLTAALVATQSSLLLAYPALVATYEGTGGRLSGVRAYVVVFHSSAVVATLAGAGVMALPNPRIGISSFALLDAALAVLCYRVLQVKERPSWTHSAGRKNVAPQVWGKALVAVAGLAAVFEIATTVIRPFFTEYAASGGFSLLAQSVLFFLPSAVALLVVPFAGRVRRRLGAAFLPAGFAIAAAGLLCQALAPHLVPLLVGRVLFGAGFGLGHIALDLAMFEIIGTAGPSYTAVETMRTGALLVSPLLAAGAASASLSLPLAAGGLLFAIAAALALPLASRSALEEEHAAAYPS
jgi:hypothetical protein